MERLVTKKCRASLGVGNENILKWTVVIKLVNMLDTTEAVCL